MGHLESTSHLRERATPVKTRGRSFVAVAVYVVVTAYSYTRITSPVYAYMGLVTNINLFKLVVALGAVAAFYALQGRGERVSDYLAYLLYLNALVPGLVIGALADFDNYYFVVFILAYMTVFASLRYLPPLAIGDVRFGRLTEKRFVALLFVGTLGLWIFLVYRLGGVDVRTLDILGVSAIRNEIVVGTSGYLGAWLSSVLIPVLMVYAAYYGKKALLVISIAMQLVFYASSGQKTVLFSVVLVILVVVLARTKRWYGGLPIVYSLMLAVADLIYMMYKDVSAIAIINVRLFAMPAVISNRYVEFFQANPYLRFSEGLIGTSLGIPYPYTRSIGYVVAENYGLMNDNENTGFISDAFSNGGLVAVVVISLLLVIILWYVDGLTRGSRNLGFYACLLAYPMTMLSNGSLLTVILTQGLFLLLLIVFVFRRVDTSAGGSDVSAIDALPSPPVTNAGRSPGDPAGRAGSEGVLRRVLKGSH